MNCFNSTLVRFKLEWLTLELEDRKQVSIPLWFDSNRLALTHRSATTRCFNSTLVRFKLRGYADAVDGRGVSIPLWFDSNVDEPNG